MRYSWVEAWLDRLDDREMRELVNEAWRMVVPKSVAAATWEPPGAVMLASIRGPAAR